MEFKRVNNWSPLFGRSAKYSRVGMFAGLDQQLMGLPVAKGPEDLDSPAVQVKLKDAKELKSLKSHLYNLNRNTVGSSFIVVDAPDKEWLKQYVETFTVTVLRLEDKPKNIE